jgi:hypothetical protein
LQLIAAVARLMSCHDTKTTEGFSAVSIRPADPGANSGQKFCYIDWFRYVVICPNVKAENPVCRLTSTQHKKWNILRLFPDLATEILDRFARKPYIQNDKVRLRWSEYSRYHSRKIRNSNHVVGWQQNLVKHPPRVGIAIDH